MCQVPLATGTPKSVAVYCASSLPPAAAGVTPHARTTERLNPQRAVKAGETLCRDPSRRRVQDKIQSGVNVIFLTDVAANNVSRRILKSYLVRNRRQSFTSNTPTM